MRAPIAMLLVAAALLGACRESTLSLDIGGIGGERPGDGLVLSDPDAVVDAALADLDRYWSDTYPELFDEPFEELEGGFIPYGPGVPPFECGGPLTYEEIADNALYCPREDLIAWDRVALIPALQEEFGSLVTGMVMAHEFSHAIQVRAGFDAPTVILELQADCFAGAWVDDVDGRLATFATDDHALEGAMAGLLELRDALGVDDSDPQAHGSGFDRISAFQDGFEHGARDCVTYIDDPPDVLALPFTDRSDFRTAGNLPLDQLLDPLIADLDSFFAEAVAEAGGIWEPPRAITPVDPGTEAVICGGTPIAPLRLALGGVYCDADHEIFLDVITLVPRLEAIGDMAFGGELARAYGLVAQRALGLDADPVGTALHADCATGAFAAAEFHERVADQQLKLSPGDLDEIVIEYLHFDDPAIPDAFARTRAFRDGFSDGFQDCSSHLD